MGNKSLQNFIREEHFCGSDINCKVFSLQEPNEIKTNDRSKNIQDNSTEQRLNLKVGIHSKRIKRSESKRQNPLITTNHMISDSEQPSQDFQFLNEEMHRRAPLQVLTAQDIQYFDDFSNVRLIFQGGKSHLAENGSEQSIESMIDGKKAIELKAGKMQMSFRKSANKLQQSQLRNAIAQTTNKENLSPIDHLSAIKLQLFQGYESSGQGLISTTNSQPRNLILYDINSTLNSQFTNENIKITSYCSTGTAQPENLIKKNKSQVSLKGSVIHQSGKLSPLELIQKNLELPDSLSTLLEGNIMKYKPGMSSQYCNRFIILSKLTIAVFPSKWQAKLPHIDQAQMKTIIKIPIQAIETCQRVKVQVNSKGESQFFQFEIFLKEEYQDELMNMEALNMRKTQQNHQETNLISTRTLESQEYSVHQMHSPTNAEWLKRSIPSEVPSQSKQGTASKHRRSGSNLSNIIHQSIYNKHRSSIVSSQQLESMRQSMVTQNKQQMDDIFEKNLKEPSITYGIMAKNPSSWIKGLNNHQTWTHREIEGYCGQKRLLFACQTEEECGLWVLAINMVINHHLQSKALNQL